jgi:hypothetical protein
MTEHSRLVWGAGVQRSQKADAENEQLIDYFMAPG